MELKRPINCDEQIQMLRTHGIVINDESFARLVLNNVGYYRLTGYALQYRKDTNSSDLSSPISLEHLYHIYKFDEKLRSLLRRYLEICEVYYRTQIADGFALRECIQPPHNQHYDEKNFYKKDVYNSVMESFNKERDYYKDGPIVKHHMAKYEGKMPIWVMTELLSFSSLSRLYSAMYNTDKECIAKNCGTTSKTLEKHLHCLSVLRNKCAHCSRLYNAKMTPPVRLSKSFLTKHPEINNTDLSAYIIMLMMRLPDKRSKTNLLSDMTRLINEESYDIDLSQIGMTDKYLDLLVQLSK